MEAVFLKMLNMCITAGWIALAVVIIRFHLKKAPRVVTLLLWGLVAVRLVCPFSVESFLSLIPNDETIPYDIMYAEHPNIQTGIPGLGSRLNSYMYYELAPNIGDSANPMQIIVFVASIIWIAGMGIMMLYALISYIRICQKVKGAVCLKENIYYCDTIDTPFILGFFKPRIYLPSGISEEDANYVISHEFAHINRFDHVWRPLGFLLLCVYWYNPILWVAYVLFCKDIEFACDERVIRKLGVECKKPYSMALINCSASHKMTAVYPLAFGETGVKSRVKSVLNYRKPAFWVMAVCIILCVALSVCFLTDPKQSLRAKNETEVLEFKVTEVYDATKFIYSAAHFSSVGVYEMYMPTFYMPNGENKLYMVPVYTGIMTSTYQLVSEMKKIKLTEENFDDLLTDEMWREGYYAQLLRNGNSSASYAVTQDGEVFFYILRQYNNDAFAVMGYTDTQEIRYIFELEPS